MLSKFPWKQHRRIRIGHRSIHADHSPSHQFPDYVDLRSKMPRVVNQRDMNTWCILLVFFSIRCLLLFVLVLLRLLPVLVNI